MNSATPSNPLVKLAGQLSPALERIDDYLRFWAQQTPSSEAAIEGDRALTYAELEQLVDAACAHLRVLNLRDGDVLAVLAPPSIDFFVLYLASHRIGASWLGLNPKYTRHELEQTLLDAQPTLVLARAVIGERAYHADVHALSALAELDACRFAWIGPAVSGSDLAHIEPCSRVGCSADGGAPMSRASNPIAALVYTSGSTGRPKAARLSHRALIRGALVRAQVWHVDPFRTINNVPINHVGSLGDLACTALVAGGAQVFLESFSAAGTLEAISRHQLTYWYQAPTMFEMCLAAPQAATMDWSHLQAAIWSGGRASAQLIDKLANVAQRLGVDYSMTESVGAITLSPLTDNAHALEQAVGWPDPARGLRVADPATGSVVPDGEVGEAQIHDPWMFDGYRDAGAAGGLFCADGWFKTGDLVRVNPDGSWRIVGRCKEMFKSGGYNVYPREVEQVIESHPEVREAVVVDVPDALYGEVGVAFVTLVQGPANALALALAQHCRAHLANYKIPKRIIVLPALPMLPIGKVDRVALKELTQSDTGFEPAARVFKVCANAD